jgi:dTDP-4-amino-4,6-dideoxygalactose transaminase
MGKLKSAKLAMNGGEPIRTEPFPKWPVWDESDVEAMAATLKSGHWGIGGSKIKEFEEAFAAFQHAKYAVCCTNGTTGLEIALRAVGLEAGDEVIVPPYTFIATASACLMTNTVPVFADIEPDTYNLDPRRAEEAITDRTRAIIAVHIAGCPADMDGIMDVARRRGLRVIEDCAQAHAAEWKGRRVGAIGDVGVFSFQSSKNLNAGEGGCCVTDSEELYVRCWSLHNVGRIPEGKWYEHRLLGGNKRMTEFQAALLLNQLKRVEEQANRRSENGARLTQRLSRIEGIKPTRVDERVTRHAYHLYVFRYEASAFNELPREEFTQAMNAEGITCTPGYSPLYEEAAFRNLDVYSAGLRLAARKMDYDEVRCPVAERACKEEAVWLYQAWLLGTRKDMDDIVRAVEKIKEAALEA